MWKGEGKPRLEGDKLRAIHLTEVPQNRPLVAAISRDRWGFQESHGGWEAGGDPGPCPQRRAHSLAPLMERPSGRPLNYAWHGGRGEGEGV
ncbi:hypothetical protein AALO_G00065320 [Alosa alosa]|uniref:Uncharacterized protein n=1 Tax=Alosa alosa TaxID=278164 RepID=A0AAV6H4G8_9TELE|nr:hypothetical protein AALO_G00065320 [Alosa alosa]